MLTISFVLIAIACALHKLILIRFIAMLLIIYVFILIHIYSLITF